MPRDAFVDSATGQPYRFTRWSPAASQANPAEQAAAGALHQYLEASALAFADRGKYVGDPAFGDVPTAAFTDPLFGKERACRIDPRQAAVEPVAPGSCQRTTACARRPRRGRGRQ